MSLLSDAPPPEDFEEVIHTGPFPIRFPKGAHLSQDEEWCEVQWDGKWNKIRFHDYREVYKIPGLYETIFYRTLRCNSPNQVAGCLGEVLKEQNVSPSALRVLDLGAGNGMAGEALQTLGARKIIGCDILPEGKMATLRDRPWVYEKYLVGDFTNLTEDQDKLLRAYNLNTLCIVAALGFGDIPPLAFFNAFNYISDPGLVAFNIKDEFLKKGRGGSSFASLINLMIQEEIIDLLLLKRYQHRLSVTGDPLYYAAIVARKNHDIPKDLLVTV